MNEPVNHDAPDGLERIIAETRGFTPQRLTLAREMAGLDLKEVAERIDMTPSAVGQFESGKARPKLETVIRLALVLGVSPAFFSAPPLPAIELAECKFRSLRGASVKERRRITTNGSLLKQLSDYLHELVNFPPEQLTRLRALLAGAPDADAQATIVRDAWALGQGPISHMVKLLEAKGALPVEVTGHSDKLDAFSVWIDGKPLVFLTSDKGAASRRRWDAAHELGHLLLHRDSSVTVQQEEDEAHAFAGAFLLPRIPFMAECPHRLDWNRLRALKRRWGVSLAAIVKRAYDLGIYTEATYRRAFTTLNQLGWRKLEPDEPPMERPELLQRAIALVAPAGYTLRRIGSDLSIGEGKLTALLRVMLTPPDGEQLEFV